jgi:hypothetical protein
MCSATSWFTPRSICATDTRRCDDTTEGREREEGTADLYRRACSKVGNDQHNPGEPLHWAKEKSIDEADALVRHLLERGKVDSDGVRHSAKVAWRALALLQRELDNE